MVSVGVSLVDGVSEFVKEGASLVTLFGVVDRATWVGVADLRKRSCVIIFSKSSDAL